MYSRGDKFKLVIKTKKNPNKQLQSLSEMFLIYKYDICHGQLTASSHSTKGKQKWWSGIFSLTREKSVSTDKISW